jgi:hypothetical protein
MFPFFPTIFLMLGKEEIHSGASLVIISFWDAWEGDFSTPSSLTGF